jgi:hypothetical protein
VNVAICEPSLERECIQSLIDEHDSALLQATRRRCSAVTIDPASPAGWKSGMP